VEKFICLEQTRWDMEADSFSPVANEPWDDYGKAPAKVRCDCEDVGAAVCARPRVSDSEQDRKKDEGVAGRVVVDAARRVTTHSSGAPDIRNALRRHMKLGHISAIFRYPVKSMAGESLDVARLGWHGIEGDRRFAFRKLTDKSNFPWLTASRLPELILYKPLGLDSRSAELFPTHVRTPDGNEYELQSKELQEEISRRFGSEVELMNLKAGVFDEAAISVITSSTVQCIERESGRDVDLRRFRPNVVIESDSAEPFEEDRWVGQTLIFGEGDNPAAVKIYMKDERCRMVNLDPDTAERDVQVMRTVARQNQNYAGGYGTVVRAAELRVGQVVTLGE
jgi:uncharacterized protein